MSKLRHTRVTLAVSLDLPQGKNLKDITDMVRLTLQDPNGKLEADLGSITVRLASTVEKVVWVPEKAQSITEIEGKQPRVTNIMNVTRFDKGRKRRK